MYHYKVYYQYFAYGSVCFGSIEYSTKKKLSTGDDYNELEDFVKSYIECKEIFIGNVIPITKLSTKKKEKQVEV